MFNQTSNQLNRQLGQLAREGLINPAELEEAHKLTGQTPDSQSWKWFIDTALLSLGALFVVSGILFFFAWNWADISRLSKFGIIGFGILLTAGFAFFNELDKLPSKVSLTASSGLIGVLFAVMGQEYQSSADAWSLFFLWAIFAAGWVVIGRFQPLWLGWFALINLTAYLWLDQTSGFNVFTDDSQFIFNTNLIVILNCLLLAGWELVYPQLEWANGRWLPRTFTFPILTGATTAMLFIIFEGGYLAEGQTTIFLLTLLVYSAIVLLGIFYYGYRKQDLFMVTGILFSLIIVITSKIGEILFDWNDSEFMALLLGIIVIGLGWAAFQFLRNLQKQQKVLETI